ncbi:E3 ubiquitin-protein ligase TRIM35-like [Thunnus thynnus]|uniref:E3 ubiquitin-protein ligase TRIM35-like n=1 Tax=Thunnus thynnus TaxID=8237 RepID=UPI003528F632
MASKSEKDLSCPVCHDIFRDPVLLSCSHSFCHVCVTEWWKCSQKTECPLCKRSSKNKPPRNLALKNLCEAFLLERDQRASGGSEALCSLHSEKLKLFCLDHQQPVCVVCLHSKTHTNHSFRPIGETVKDHKEELQKSLKPLQDKLKLFKEVKENFDRTAELIKVQARHAERKIKEQFKRFHQLLQEEEETRITALREEEEQKSKVMRSKIELLSREIAALSDTVRATEEELRAEDVSFLQNFKAAVERVQQRPLLDDPELVPRALINVAKHLGNLTYSIWFNIMKTVSYSPVILDPNTANSGLIVSEDMTSVRRGEGELLPENPERFDCYCSVLGYENIISWIPNWDIEVGNNTDWRLGVANESLRTKGPILSGLWMIMYYRGEYKAHAPPDKPITLPIDKKLKRIRIHTHWVERKVSFSDPDTDRHIHTFKHTFTENLCLYINTVNEHPIKILPFEFSVKMERPQQAEDI